MNMAKVIYFEERNLKVQNENRNDQPKTIEQAEQLRDADHLVEIVDKTSKVLFTFLICLGGPYLLWVIIEAIIRLP